MAQKRYFNYNELLRSKEASEAIALGSGGIGPVFGFNSARYIPQSKELNLLPSSTHKQDLLDREGVTHSICGCVITNDGIITIEEGVWLSLKDVTLEINKYYFVLATHRYIEDSAIESPTTYSVIEVPDITFSNPLESKTINDWLFYLRLIDSSLLITHTIVCLLKVSSFGSIGVFTPYNYIWPSKDFLIANNTKAIEANKEVIANNTKAIEANKEVIANNTKAIANNTKAISNNTEDIANLKKLSFKRGEFSISSNNTHAVTISEFGSTSALDGHIIDITVNFIARSGKASTNYILSGKVYINKENTFNNYVIGTLTGTTYLSSTSDNIPIQTVFELTLIKTSKVNDIDLMLSIRYPSRTEITYDKYEVCYRIL